MSNQFHHDVLQHGSIPSAGSLIHSVGHGQVSEAALHMSLGIGLRLFNMLEKDCQEMDLLLALEVEEGSRTAAEEELVALLRSAQTLEDEARECSETAEQHMTVVDWYSTLAQPEEDDDYNIPLDEQLKHLRGLVEEHLKSAAVKVSTMSC